MRSNVIFMCLAAVLAICILPQSVSSLQCYICNNYDHKNGCGHGSDVSDEFLQECDDQPAESGGVSGAKYDFCRKIVTTIEFNVNNNTATERIVRKCGYLESKYDEECYYRGGFGGRQRVCSCKSNKCNSAFTFNLNYLLMSIALIATSFVTLKQF